MASVATKRYVDVLDARKGMFSQPQYLTADDAEDDSAVTGNNVIVPGITSVIVTGTTNGADDFIVLPALSSIPDGFQIKVIGNAGGNFEVRTPDGDAEEINSVDCDNSNEYLFTDTELVLFTKVNGTIGWEGHGWSQIGAVVTAVIPD